MLFQLVSIAGALLVLAAYMSLQRGWLGREHRWFHVLNFVGSALLTWIAIVDQRIGFMILEGAWALLSIPGMISPPAPQGGSGD